MILSIFVMLLSVNQLSAEATEAEKKAARWRDIDHQYRRSRIQSVNPTTPTPSDLKMKTISNPGGGYCNQYSVLHAANARGTMDALGNIRTMSAADLTELLVDVVRRIKTEVLPPIRQNALVNTELVRLGLIGPNSGLSAEQLQQITGAGGAATVGADHTALHDIKIQALAGLPDYQRMQADAVYEFMRQERARHNIPGDRELAVADPHEGIINIIQSIDRLTQDEIDHAVAEPHIWTNEINDVYTHLMGLMFPTLYMAVWNERTTRWEPDIKGLRDTQTILYLHYSGGHYEALGLDNDAALSTTAVVFIVIGVILLIALMLAWMYNAKKESEVCTSMEIP